MDTQQIVTHYAKLCVFLLWIAIVSITGIYVLEYFFTDKNSVEFVITLISVGVIAASPVGIVLDWMKEKI